MEIVLIFSIGEKVEFKSSEGICNQYKKVFEKTIVEIIGLYQFYIIDVYSFNIDTSKEIEVHIY